jgi:hypothetical protein
MDPQVVWDHVEEQLDFIGAMGEWEPAEPTVVDVTGFGACTETVPARWPLAHRVTTDSLCQPSAFRAASATRRLSAGS